MKDRYGLIKLEGLTQVMGDRDQLLNQYADHFMVSITPSSGATGSISFEAKPTVDTDFEDVIDPKTDTAHTIDVGTKQLSLILSGYLLHTLRIKPTSLVGTYSVTIQQASA